jgi:hypothetical protein
MYSCTDLPDGKMPAFYHQVLTFYCKFKAEFHALVC